MVAEWVNEEKNLLTSDDRRIGGRRVAGGGRFVGHCDGTGKATGRSQDKCSVHHKTAYQGGHKMKRAAFLAIALMLLALLSAYADNVEVKNVEDNKGAKYVVRELKEGDVFFHDRAYTITNIPGEFLGLTQIQTSADSPGGQDYRLTFEIDRDAYIYMAWDSRHKRPEGRGQDPKGWFTDNYTDTGKTLFLDTPHPKTKYWIYRSNKPYPKGKVELLGIDEVVGDPVIMWTIFLEEGSLQVQPGEKLTTTWAEVKEMHR